MGVYTRRHNDSSPRHEIIPEDADQLDLPCLSCENHYAAGYTYADRSATKLTTCSCLVTCSPCDDATMK